jgi:hypothetical protein
MLIMRGLGLLFAVLGGAMLAVGLGGFGEDWIAANVACGAEYDQHVCAPGEAQGVLNLVGGIFLAVGLIELAVSLMWGRMTSRVLGGPTAALATATVQPSAAWMPAAPPAPAADTLVDRLARLTELRDRGVLTEAEFQAQKVRLI